MLIKEIINLLKEDNNEIKILDTNNKRTDKISDIFIDENKNLIFYIGESTNNGYCVKELIKIIKEGDINYNNRMLVDCNEYVTIKKAYTNNKNIILEI